MSLFKWLDRFISERGSAAIMEKRLALKDDEIAKLQSQIRDLQAAHDKEKIESDEVKFHSAIEFRRGKSTGGQWMPFCPKCKMPARVSNNFGVICSADCGWVSDLAPNELQRVVAQL
jgi:hypothetical protein